MSNANTSDAPLYEAVRAYAAAHPLRLHTPGHAGKSTVFGEEFAGILPLDVTELPETDSLFEASGPILAAERRAAAAFGAAGTLFSAGGATLCIEAMFRLVSRSGKKTVLCARGAHRSAMHAMALLDLAPVWLWPEPLPGTALAGAVPPEAVAEALAAHPDAAAVYLTSPDYFGTLSDIGAISALCRRYDVPLLVDCAHGTHLHYLDGGARHPLAQGASLVCDSAHKTLPVLTGGAFLQLGSRRFSYAEAKEAMALFGSSSPSYLILISLDLARAWGEKEGAAAFERLRARVQALYKRLGPKGLFPPPGPRDPVRLTLDTGALGLSGAEAAAFLRQKGVSPEMWADRYLVMLPTPFHTEDDFARLERALLALPERAPLAVPRFSEPEHPEAVMTPHEALCAPCERVAVTEAAGRAAAEDSSPCPPGIPLVCPGERVTPSLAAALKNYGVDALNVVK